MLIKDSLIDTVSSIEFLKKIRGFFGILDLKSKFVMVNTMGAEWTGFKSAESMIGLSYSDVRCRASEHAELFMQHDKKVIKNGDLKFLGYYCYANDNWKIIVGEKYTIRNEENNAIGLVSHFNDFTNYNLINIGRFLVNHSKKTYHPKSEKQFFYILDDHYQNINLTNRQSECLFFLLRGKTIKEIAKILNLSPRTIESYIEIIKFKLNCCSKKELFEKFIDNGYINIVPKSLIGSF